MGEKLPDPVIRSSGFVPMEQVLTEIAQAEDHEWDRLQNLKRLMEDDSTLPGSEADHLG